MPNTPDLNLPDECDDINSLIIRISKLLKELSTLTADDMGLVRRRSLQVSCNIYNEKYEHC